MHLVIILMDIVLVDRLDFRNGLVRPADWISGLQDGDTIHFKFEFMKQSVGGWNYVNNQHTNSESASNGVMVKQLVTFNVESVPASGWCRLERLIFKFS